MRRFQKVTFSHEGKEFVVPPTRIMGLIDVVEEHTTLGEIVQDQGQRKTVRFGKLAQAYAAALRYAGAEVTDEEIYISLMPNSEGAKAMQARSSEIVTALLQLMIPPEEALEDKDLGNESPESKGDGGS